MRHRSGQRSAVDARKASRPRIARVLGAFRHALSFRAPGWSVVGDLAAGTRQAFFGWAAFAEIVVLVVEPTARSILSARRLSRLRSSLTAARFVVAANKTHRSEDIELIRDSMELPLVGTVPYDELVRDAERRGLAPIDAVLQAPAMRAIGDLLRALEAVVEAGVGNLTRMSPASVDAILVVVEPSPKSIEAARRAREIAAERRVGPVRFVANRVRDDRDRALLRDQIGGVDWEIPEDPAILRADREGRSPLDTAPDAPAVRAIGRIAAALSASAG